MLDWFEKSAPIRTKFKALLGVHTAIASTGVVTTWLAGGSPALVGGAAAACAATAITVLVSGKRVCDPYVNTVVRMEALAAGDTETPIQYTDYTDCVGRMTKAMSAFRDNAVEVQRNRAAQEKIVNSLSEGLYRLSSNELDYRIADPFPGDYDALRNEFNKALGALSETMVSVRGAAGSVNNGATEIRAASDDLALRNEQQAASLEETAAAMNQVTESVKATADSASEVQRTVTEAHKEATEGGEVVKKAIAAMAAIEQQSQEITQIINVIDGIAFQTNLLALNAGVEAARAGDAGKGFAVVANEVRALAQRSADAAKDIKGLINASTEQVSGGVALVGETGNLLEKIVTRVGDIAERIEDIAGSAERQSVNLQQVNVSVGDMDRMTQQNAAMVEQSTAAARSLAQEAQQLEELVAQFRTGGGGQSGGSARPAPSADAGVTVAFPSASRRKAAPPVHGNLAVKMAPSSEDDWSEF